jgi:uncharacterized membrane protein YeaQ/YmgE (transglycosylase-associated protein family)
MIPSDGPRRRPFNFAREGTATREARCRRANHRARTRGPAKETIVDLYALIIWLVVGGVAGWLAGLIMSGGGYGIVGDIVIGIVGSIIAGWLFGSLHVAAGPGLLGSIIAATIGAVVLIVILRLIRRIV